MELHTPIRLSDRPVRSGRMFRSLANERGAVSVMLALGITVFLAVAALAIDLGLLLTARTEAQRTADGAALAGASSLIAQPNNQAAARARAKQFAAINPVRNTVVTLRDQDIDVPVDTVRVRVLRTGGWGGPISTIFARVFGRDVVDVDAVAAAKVSEEAASVSCLLPVALPDRWVNFGSLEWDPTGEGDYYEPPYLPSGQPNADYVGYNTIGELITLLPSQGGQGQGSGGLPSSSRLQPGYWDLWLPQGLSGVPSITERILGCPEGPSTAYDPGDPLYRESGNKQTLATDFETILNDPQYSGQYYDANCMCVKDANNGNQVVTGGLRYRAVPVFDPGTFTQQGSGPHFVISHFIGIFIDSMDTGPPGQRNIYARIMPAVGFGNGNPGAGPLVFALKLVQ